MTSPQLPNYLRSNRKRLALSQDEVAFLLGTQNGAKVCRYERFVREPGLATALAYEAIFKRTVSELFPGLYQKVEREVAARAKTLAARTDRRKSNRQKTRGASWPCGSDNLIQREQNLPQISAHIGNRTINQRFRLRCA
jgi:transcriptional regulator with XRE-family HTH domain